MILKRCSYKFIFPVLTLSLQEESAGVMVQVESLRGRMGKSTRQALGRACRDLEGLFESLLAEAFDGHT
jgi:hypothetical protein